MEAVHRYEGTVNQVLGDGIMALFGAPLAHEDHAVRACYAALAMQEAIRGYTERSARPRDRSADPGRPQLRRGGGARHRQRPAHGLLGVGQTTHLAARMEQLATPGASLTAGHLRLAEGWSRSNRSVRSRSRGCRIRWRSSSWCRAGPDASAGVCSPWAHPLRGAASGDGAISSGPGAGRCRHGQLVAVMGEPGVGKSRLFYEFICSHRTQGWLLLESAPGSPTARPPLSSHRPPQSLLSGSRRGMTSARVREKVPASSSRWMRP